MKITTLFIQWLIKGIIKIFMVVLDILKKKIISRVSLVTFVLLFYILFVTVVYIKLFGIILDDIFNILFEYYNCDGKVKNPKNRIGIDIINKYIDDEKKARGVYYTSQLEEALLRGYCDSIVNFNKYKVDTYDKDIVYYIYPNPVITLYFDYFISKYNLSGVEYLILLRFYFFEGQDFSITYDELYVLLKFRRIHAQHNIPGDIECWVKIMVDYKHQVGANTVDLSILNDIYDIFLVRLKHPYYDKTEILNRLIAIKREYNNQYYIIDMIEASQYKEYYKVSIERMLNGLGLHNQFKSWAIVDIIYMDMECTIPLEILHKHFIIKTKSKDKNLALHEIILLHQNLYGNFSVEEFIIMLEYQNYYPNTLELCRALKNIEPTMTIEKIGEILKLDQKYNKSLFQRGGYYFTGRKYSAGQLLEIWTELRLPKGGNIENIEERERRVLDYLYYFKFDSFYKVEDTRCWGVRHNRRGW